ncbi:MAG: hypothetical protein ACRDD8_15295 [Bacteroidales bacterium]
MSDEAQMKKLDRLIDSIESRNGSITRITRKEAESMTVENRRCKKTWSSTYNNPTGATEIVSISSIDI